MLSGGIPETQLAQYTRKASRVNSLGENISQLIFRSNKGQLYCSILNVFLDEVSVDFDMFSPIVLYWILRYADGCIVITEELTLFYSKTARCRSPVNWVACPISIRVSMHPSEFILLEHYSMPNCSLEAISGLVWDR
ncbi:uncharacterized protein LOC121781857 isoform X3 [Salvia splendens]|uniref:uncharacterized protein LOC121781857 isoform X3 n=1 Tax=Salvia splendens TaxID=180675 RepID=UPI001C25FD77|nr:uncharacterized protein LOC121781857 isoform X3 [Salvia splendens]